MRLDHVNIVVEDMERSRRFYGDVLGLEPGFEATLEGEWIERVTGLTGARAHCVFFEFPGAGARIELLEYYTAKGGQFYPNRFPSVIGARHIAFEVDDMADFVARLTERGVVFVSEPIEVPFRVGAIGRKWVCYFHDPDGVLLEAAAYDRSEPGGGASTEAMEPGEPKELQAPSVELPAFALSIRDRYPEVWKAYSELGDAASTAGPIDSRAVRLVKLGIAIGAGSEGSVHSHARRALEEGISVAELEQVALLAITTTGWSRAMAGLAWINDVTNGKGRGGR